MYLDYYQLSAKPFPITSDPKFLWLGEKHKEALATLRYGILDNRGFLLLTGEVGTGKTLLIHRLLTLLDRNTIVVTLPDPDLEGLDFYNLLADGFDMNRTFDSKGPFLVHLRDFLYQSYADGKQVLLIIDECQRLKQPLMDDIRVLSNIELHDRKLINIFFVGQQEFNARLSGHENRALAQRITVRYHLPPLEKEEIAPYIFHRLRVAGGKRKIFTPSAIERVYHSSGGIPRLINILCDHALLTGYASGLRRIDASVIDECAQELSISTQPSANAEKPVPGASDSRSIAAAAKAHSPESRPEAIRSADPEAMSRKDGDAVPGLHMLVYAGIVMALVLVGFAVTHFSREERVARETRRIEAHPSAAMNGGVYSIEADAADPDPQPNGLRPLPPIQGKIRIDFAEKSNEIEIRSLTVLDRIAAYLREHPDERIKVRRYTDANGSPSISGQISRLRAAAVEAYLVERGAAAGQIRVYASQNDSSPPNETAVKADRPNRVEIEFETSPFVNFGRD